MNYLSTTDITEDKFREKLMRKALSMDIKDIDAAIKDYEFKLDILKQAKFAKQQSMRSMISQSIRPAQTVKLHDYQQLAKDFLIKTPKAGLFLDVGFGKTLTTLSALDELNLNEHILLIAPKAIARSTWRDEIDKWGFKFKTVSLIVNENDKPLSKKKRLELYDQISSHEPAIYFINRELVPDLIQWHIDNKRNWLFPNIVIDELQSFKSCTSQRFKMIKKVMPAVKRFIGLTGTPVPNGLMDLWSEIYLMDNGQRLGKSITQYRTVFFRPGYTLPNGVVTEWIPLDGGEEAIYDRIKDVVISIKNPSIKLPEVTYNDMYCYMDEKETRLYKKLAKEQIIEIVDKNNRDVIIQAKNSGVLSVRLAQMASGTIYTEKNTTTNLDYITIHKHKLEQLKYIIENTGDNILVAYHFRSDEKEIINFLTKEGIPVKKFDGSPAMMKEWNDKKIPVMLLQPASFAHGINIQHGGHTLVWYTVPTSLEEYIQTNGRLHRQGQQHPVMVHHLLTANTIDKRLLNNIIRKDTSEKALLDAIDATITDLDNI